jgi:hypothetical protein
MSNTPRYTPDEIKAYSQSFAKRMMMGEDAAYVEFWLWMQALDKVSMEIPL